VGKRLKSLLLGKEKGKKGFYCRQKKKEVSADAVLPKGEEEAHFNWPFVTKKRDIHPGKGEEKGGSIS